MGRPDSAGQSRAPDDYLQGTQNRPALQDRENSYDCGSLKLVRPHRFRRSRVQAKSLRRDVERVLSLHYQLDSFPFRTTIAALVQRGTGGAGRSSSGASESEMRMWKATISAKLMQLPLRHRQALLDAAEQKFWIDAYRRDARDLGHTLGSPSARARLGARRRQVSDVRELALAAAEILGERRKAITHARLYREALALFHRCCSIDAATRRYCFREPGPADEAQFSTCITCGIEIARISPSWPWRPTTRGSACGTDHPSAPSIIATRQVWSRSS